MSFWRYRLHPQDGLHSGRDQLRRRAGARLLRAGEGDAPHRGKTLAFKNGECERTSKYVAVNIGTVVLGQTTKKKPDYFGLDVGQVPGGTTRPAPSDGHYTGATVAIVYGGKSYVVRGNTAKVTLSGNRSKGTLSGTLFLGGSGTVTGSFSC